MWDPLGILRTLSISFEHCFARPAIFPIKRLDNIFMAT